MTADCTVHPEKRRYTSPNRALNHMLSLIRKQPYVRVYQCPGCHGWHVTKRRG